MEEAERRATVSNVSNASVHRTTTTTTQYMLCNRIRPKLLLRLRIKKRDYIRNYMAAMDVHPITGQLMSTEEKDAVSRHLRYVETGDIRQWTVEGDLSTELRDARSRFLRDVETGDARQWTVVMGNESGGKYSPSFSYQFYID